MSAITGYVRDDISNFYDVTKFMGAGTTSQTPQETEDTSTSSTASDVIGTIYKTYGETWEKMPGKHPIINSKKKKRAIQSKRMRPKR